MRELYFKIKNLMYGRNGVDGLGAGLFVLGLILRNAAYFSRNVILNFISIGIYIYMIFRIFSKNLDARQKENAFFMKYTNKIIYFFRFRSSLARERAAVKKTHKIYLCPKCKRKLKVPKGKGKIEISCPCSYKFFKKT